MDFTLSRTSIKVIPKNVFAELPQTYTISAEQRKFFADNGFLVIKELIDFSTLYSCKQRFIKICKGVVDKGNILVVKEPTLINKAQGEDLINKVQDILYDEVFSLYTENPRLLDVVSQLVGDDVTAVHSMLINKPPGTSRHPPHQDLFYFPFRPAEKILAAWTAIDHVHRDNGCLFVMPGSHRPGTLHRHGNARNATRMYHGILTEDTVAPADKRVHLEMSPGDTVFFHPLLVHGSGPNITKNYRKAISCHYAESGCQYVTAADAGQEGLVREVEQQLQKKGYQLTYADAWKFKSKQVKGVRSNL